jgi:hypothetical protein
MDVGKLVAYLGLNTQEFDAKLGSSVGRVREFGAQAIGAIALASGIIATAIIGWGKAFVEAYNKSAEAVAKLTTALDGQKTVTESLVKYAGELQDKTLFDDETTIRAMSLVAAFTKEEEKIRTLLPIIQDLATAKSMGLASATDIVTKSIFTNVNALGRYIGKMELSSDTNQRFITITERLNELYKGQAEAARQANTSIIPLKDTISDLMEVFGKAIVEGTALKKVLDNLNESLKKIRSSLPHNEAIEFIEDFKKFELAGKDVTEQIALLTKAQSEYNEKMQQYLEFDVMTKGQVKSYGIMVDLYREVASALGQYAKELREAAEVEIITPGLIDNINTKIKDLQDTLGGLTSKSDIKQTLIAIYDYQQELKDLTDLTPEIEALTTAQNKNAQVIIGYVPHATEIVKNYVAMAELAKAGNYELTDSFKEIGVKLEKTSPGWASYKENIWETIQGTESFAEIAVPLIVNSIDGIGQALESLIANNDAIHDFFRNIALMVADVAIQIGKMIVAMGAAALISKLTRKEGLKIIAEGGALITAGYIAKGYINKGSNSYSSVSPGNSSYGSPNSLNATRISVAVTGELDGRKLSIVGARGTKMLSQVT